MRKKWLILDCHYLAWRAHYAMRGSNLTDGFENRTEVLFNFLRDIAFLQAAHYTDRIIFCFDYGESRRKELYSAYKENRKKSDSPEELARVKGVRSQISALRKNILRQVGFKNIFYKKGFEADDIVASICKSIPRQDEVVIIAADQDFYQLLNKRVWMWNPTTKEPMTLKQFKQTYQISPKQWALMKAIAGCPSDNIKGIVGVGETTAIKFLRGDLNETCKAYQSIENGGDIISANLELTQLPFPGTPNFALQEDQFDRKSWNKITEDLDMLTLRKKKDG